MMKLIIMSLMRMMSTSKVQRIETNMIRIQLKNIEIKMEK